MRPLICIILFLLTLQSCKMKDHQNQTTQTDYVFQVSGYKTGAGKPPLRNVFLNYEIANNSDSPCWIVIPGSDEGPLKTEDKFSNIYNSSYIEGALEVALSHAPSTTICYLAPGEKRTVSKHIFRTELSELKVDVYFYKTIYAGKEVLNATNARAQLEQAKSIRFSDELKHSVYKQKLKPLY